MKILPILLSLLLAIPLVQPCAGDLFCRAEVEVCAHPCTGEEEREAPACHQAGATDDHDSEEEHCPPGCSCLCCVTVITAQLLSPQPVDPQAPAREEIYQPAGYSHDFPDLIWQPPKRG